MFLGIRLAPDQFAFARQVQITCDTAKLAASRLTGKEAPTHADTEKTLDELRARVRSVIAYLDGFSAKDFEGAATRSVTQPRWEGKTMSGGDYFLEHAVPNFYFHLTHVYAILRHNGVSVGKRDYLGRAQPPRSCCQRLIGAQAPNQSGRITEGGGETLKEPIGAPSTIEAGRSQVAGAGALAGAAWAPPEVMRMP